MIRNFVAGALWGGVVAGVGLGVMSQVTPMPVAGVAQSGGTPEAAVPVAVQVAQAGQAAVEPVAEVPAQPVAEAAVEPVMTPAESVAEVPAEPVVTPAQPVVTPAEPNAKPAESAAEAPAQSAVTPAQPEAAAPAEPAPEGGAVQPLAPAEAPAAPVAPDAGSEPAVVASGDASPATKAPDGLPAAAGAEPAPGSAELPPPPVAEPDESLLNVAPVPKVDPAPAAIVPDPAPQPEPPKPGLLADSGPDTLAPAAGLKNDVAGVTTGRLPRIGDAAEPAVTAESPSIPEDAPPILRFARPFQNDSGKPLFAVILRDTGAADLDRAKLAALPFPLTFVIDPLADNAAEAATIYRAAGQEVVMLASGIPEGAQASDLEQTFQSHAGTLPDAVAVMDLALGGFQDSRPLATQVVSLIKAQGRGLITFDQGLNAADQVARREEVPSATIFRQLDAAGEDIPVIRRYLDRAAFKAAQEGRVMVLGDTRPETIAALMEWTVEGRASSVTLAPATAVMAVQ